MQRQGGIETGDLPDLGLVVVAHIQTGPDPDLQDTAFGPWHDFFALPPHRLHAAAEIDQVGQDVAVVPALAHVCDLKAAAKNIGDVRAPGHHCHVEVVKMARSLHRPSRLWSMLRQGARGHSLSRPDISALMTPETAA